MTDLDPGRYRQWFETPLGRQVDADEQALVFALAALEAGERVLDVGCGDGQFTAPAADRAGIAVGLDRSTAMLDAARRRFAGRADLDWVRGNAEHLPFADASFEVVLAITVLSCAHDPQAVVDEAARVLRPGGRVVLGELGRHSPWAALRRTRGWFGDTTWRHARFFTGDELRGLARQAGLVVEELRGAVFYPPIHSKRALALLRPLETHASQHLTTGGAFLALRARRPA